MAEGLEDFRDALIKCNETKIIQDLTKFIEDLISCTEGNIASFPDPKRFWLRAYLIVGKGMGLVMSDV